MTNPLVTSDAVHSPEEEWRYLGVLLRGSTKRGQSFGYRLIQQSLRRDAILEANAAELRGHGGTTLQAKPCQPTGTPAARLSDLVAGLKVCDFFWAPRSLDPMAIFLAE
eukprot:s599_g9.t1